jgi:DNA replication and repair protein RecF
VGISGSNGKGKTNLLDAIYYLCFTKSYFTRSDSQSVEHGQAGFRIEGNFTRNGEPEKVVCILRETGKKEFMLNDQPYERFAQHIGQFPCVIIAPDDVHLITGGSEERRRFMDTILSQLDPIYLQQLIDYNRILQQRNSYLKSLSDTRDHDKNLLAVYDEQLIKHGNYIHDKRKIFLAQLIPLVLKFYEQIAEKNEGVDLLYETQLSNSSFEDLLSGYRDKDMFLQRTNGGIHKDDIIIRLNQQLFRSEASQGQRKSLLFALKLAEFDILRSRKGFSPILMLDDVFEKLDEKRMHNLLHWVCVQNEGQIFITDTHAERIRTHLDRLRVKYQLMGI